MSAILAFFRQFNWIDILVGVLLVRIVLMGLAHGIAFELLKLLGTLSGLYLSLHYYSGAAAVMHRFGILQKVPLPIVALCMFGMLFALGYVFFLLLRLGLKRFITMEVIPDVSKWGGFALSFLRSVLVISLVLYALLLVHGDYFKKSLHRSLTGPALVRVAPATYSWFWNAILSKFRGQEKINKAVKDTLSGK